jgi:hypothetical protein
VGFSVVRKVGVFRRVKRPKRVGRFARLVRVVDG